MTGARGTPWSDERTCSLTSMWCWGIGSGVIARTLGGVSRDAVMGKINRLGLMGHGGSHLGRENPNATDRTDAIIEAVVELLGEPHDVDGAPYRRGMVALACLLAGHTPAAAARCLPLPIGEIADAIADMDRSGVWKVGSPPPAHWWHHRESGIAFMLDMMAGDGTIVAEQDEHGERRHGLTADAVAARGGRTTRMDRTGSMERQERENP